MKNMDPRGELTSISGQWRTVDDICVSDVQKSDIYRSDLEPSFVCWPILWKEADGTLKLSFTEATGDVALWPPVYDFNNPSIEYYIKTLLSRNGGRSWRDTGWREDLYGRMQGNSDHHIRHVFHMQDGTLLRSYTHTIEETVVRPELFYDEAKAIEDFPFNSRPAELPLLSTSIWKSVDGGKTWEEIYLYRDKPLFLATAIHPLRDGSILSTGAIIPDWVDYEGWKVGITESWDGGRTWSMPQAIAENDDLLITQLMAEESDFVELSDGRLLLIERTDGPGMNMVQMYLRRDDAGKWHATRPLPRSALVHSGYPYLCRASDGTIFYYGLTGMRTSCDEGMTWNDLPLGRSYYGQLVEVSPGRMVAVTQTHIGDRPYPWRHDTTMLQTTFSYHRIGVAEQTDVDRAGAIAVLGGGALEDFHVCAEIRVDGEAGVAFNISGGTYGFVAVVIPCNEFRAPGRAGGTEQDAIMMIGTSDAGRLRVLRRQGIGKVVPGSWIEVQMDRSGGILKAAVKTAADRPAFYFVVREDGGREGGVGLFTNKSTGAFRNIRIGMGGTEIRSHWGILTG